jgi:hypothetical protein
MFLNDMILNITWFMLYLAAVRDVFQEIVFLEWTLQSLYSGNTNKSPRGWGASRNYYSIIVWDH